MSFIDSMQHRYTTKQYDPSKKISSEEIEQLKEILRLSPSSINSQPWKFTFVKSDAIKKQLSEVSFHNTEKVLNCDYVVAFSRVDNIPQFEKRIERELSLRVVTYFKEMIKPQKEEKINAWFARQVYLALGIFLSACAEMGIDSTPMEGIEPDQYDKILGLKDHTTLVAVAIGYRDVSDPNQLNKTPKTRRDMKEVVETL